MDGGETDEVNITTDQHSDNISFNNSSIIVSAFSAEEQIIQQRGRRSPMKKFLEERHHNEQSQQYISTGEMFLAIKRKSMESPDTKSSRNLSPNPFDPLLTIHNSSVNSSISSNDDDCRRGKRNLNRTLLRTPVKRRLKIRRDSSILLKKGRRRC